MNEKAVKDFRYNILSKVGSQIKIYRTQHNLSLRNLAKQAGVNPTYLSRIERGKCNPSLINSLKIAKVLGVSLDDLVQGIAVDAFVYLGKFDDALFKDYMKAIKKFDASEKKSLKNVCTLLMDWAKAVAKRKK